MKYGLVIGLIVLALVGRVMPHPDNFTPLMAVALFSGALLPARFAFFVPLAAVAISDVLMGYAFDAMTAVIYGSLTAGAALGLWLGRARTWGRTLAAALAGSVLFFVVTNFAVWALTGAHALYPHTFAGLIDCYVMALPFFRNEATGTLFWTALLFGVFDLVRVRIGAHAPRVAL